MQLDYARTCRGGSVGQLAVLWTLVGKCRVYLRCSGL
jgi:hypothetical protein